MAKVLHTALAVSIIVGAVGVAAVPAEAALDELHASLAGHSIEEHNLYFAPTPVPVQEGKP